MIDRSINCCYIQAIVKHWIVVHQGFIGWVRDAVSEWLLCVYRTAPMPLGVSKQTYTAALAAAVGGRCAEGDDWRWGEGDRRGGGEEEEEEENEADEADEADEAEDVDEEASPSFTPPAPLLLRGRKPFRAFSPFRCSPPTPLPPPPRGLAERAALSLPRILSTMTWS